MGNRRSRPLALAMLAAISFTALGPVHTPRPAPAIDTAEKYWLFLADKEVHAEARGEAVTVDPRTIERRRRRGQSLGVWEDLPVSAEYVAAVRALGVPVLVESRWLNAISVQVTPEKLPLLRDLPFVLKIARVRALSVPDPDYASSTVEPHAHKSEMLEYGPSRNQLAFVHAIRPLEEGVNGTGVRLGFLDTRYDFEHPALRHLIDSGRLVEVRDFTGPNQAAHGADQTSFHGLGVVSVAAGHHPGQLIGPAYGAEVIAAVTEFAPTETNQEEDNFVAGLEWLEANGVDVVNVSLGYTTFDPGERSYSSSDMDGDTGITTRAADRAAQLGVVMVVSAGNSGNDAWRIIGTPADGDSVIAVGGARSDSVRVSFSSVGPTADGRIKPDLAALGASVRFASHPGGYASGSGTSFASPMVAGVVCQMLQVNPALAPMDVLDILRETASQAEQPDTLLGWGIMNAHAAVTESRARTDALPERPSILAAYPNPFREAIRFEVSGPPGGGSARLALYDVLGRRIDLLFDDVLLPGTNHITYRPQLLTSGVYFYRLETQDEVIGGSLVHVR